MKNTYLTIIASIAFLTISAQQIFVVDPLTIEKEVNQGESIEVFTMVYNYGPDTLEVIFPAFLNRGMGGPDAFGYYWIDSEEENGPEYEWIEISESGNEVEGLGDDTFAGPFQLGFDFPFYGQEKEIFFVQSNGVISFDDVLIPFANYSIPTNSEFTDFIAWFWDDLTVDTEFTHCYYKNFEDKVVIQFEKFVQYPGTEQWITAEVILHSGGDIRIMYKEVREGFDSENGTIGIQSHHPEIGLQVAYNEPYLNSEMCLRFDSPAQDGFIVNVDPSNFLLPPGTQEHIWITWDSEGFEVGFHDQDLLCVTNDTSIAPVTIHNVMHVINANTAGFHGHITDAITGNPLDDVKVRVGEQHVFTNSEGYYEFPLEPGEYTVKFIKNGYQTVIVEDTSAMTPFSILDVEMHGYYFIAGRVFAGEDYVPSAFSYLYKMSEDGTVLDIFAELTGELEWFEYGGLYAAFYIIKAEPNPNSSYYGAYLPTYYGDVLHWEDATVIHLTESTEEAHIHLVDAMDMPYGSGSISGTIDTGTDHPSGEYVPIFLRLIESGEVTMAYTDLGGNFAFDDLAYDSYEIFAEIFGKSIVPMTVTLHAETPSIDVSMMVSGDQIIFLGIEESEFISGVSQPYPNPATEQVNFFINMKKPGILFIELKDISGRTMMSMEDNIRSSGLINVDISGLPAGYYFIQVSDEHSIGFNRSFIKK
jgi:hypothetical protein